MPNDGKTTTDVYQRFPKNRKTLGVRWPKRQGVTAPLEHGTIDLIFRAIRIQEFLTNVTVHFKDHIVYRPRARVLPVYKDAYTVSPGYCTTRFSDIR